MGGLNVGGVVSSLPLIQWHLQLLQIQCLGGATPSLYHDIIGAAREHAWSRGGNSSAGGGSGLQQSGRG